MLFLTSVVYGLNLLCALVPCIGKWKPTEAYISPEYRSSREFSLIDPYPTVFTKSGLVQGYSMGTVGGRRIFGFEGIPYAEPPVGEFRFQSPRPRRPWLGLLRAMAPRPNCLQMHPLSLLRVVGSEDCLYLNIYTPKLPDGNDPKRNVSLPVILYLHGGSFYFGGPAEYGPAYLLSQDVVLVSVAYRQGVLGFLSTGDKASPGNYGLKDQQLAMKWVHANIRAFGGDPDKITLFGQSSGAVSIHFHMMNAESQKYFRNVYMLSGSAFVFWAYHTQTEALKWARKYAKVFKCPTENTVDMMSCFRRQSPEKLVAFQSNMFEFLTHPVVLFRPAVEPPDVPDRIISYPPEEAYARGLVAAKPMVISVLPDEGQIATYLMRITFRLRYTKNNLFTQMPILLEYRSHPDRNNITSHLLNYYLGTEDPSMLSDSFMSEIATDRYFMNGIQRAIEAHHSIAPTYALLFNYTGTFNSGGNLFGAPTTDWRLAHNEDLYYYLNASIYADGYSFRDPEYQITQVLSTYLVDFATHNDPGERLNRISGSLQWEPVMHPYVFRWFEVGTKFRQVPNIYYYRRLFWETLEIPGEESYVRSAARILPLLSNKTSTINKLKPLTPERNSL